MGAYFHEDDYGAVELLPLGAWAHCEQQLGRIAEHDEKHRAPDGLGWTAVFLREDAPESFEELGLTLAELSAAFSAHLPFTDQVQTGYSTHREPVKRARAWVVDEYAALYAGWDEGERVRYVFYVPSAVRPEKQALFLAALAALAALRPLLLVDWSAGALFRLDDTAALQRWIAGEDGDEA
jgi:hypothetical protein